MPPKARPDDFFGRFREIVSDPLNALIERVPAAGIVDSTHVTLHNGNRVPVAGPGAYYGDFSAILVVNRGVHEPLEEYVFQETLRHVPEAPVMLELGAYWGHYSMWLKKARPRARTILVEPEAANLAAGKSNFALNKMQGEFYQAFVGRGSFEVDRFLASVGLDRLDILHSDIQGFESEMLDGAASLLSRHGAGYVFISTHSQELHQDAITRLRAHGYRVEATADFDHETTSFDGLVFATSPAVPAVFSDFAPLGREQICDASAAARMDYLARALKSRP